MRHRAVELVFGSLIHHYGLRRMTMRGKAGAHTAMLLAAIAFNLKKLLKHRPAQHLSLAVALPNPPPPLGTLPFQLRTRSCGGKRQPAKQDENSR
ncbi:transposase [Hymenobacter sp. BT188]|uniref:transposase n=1 Tax=Hymenobacter sp. BT188 TaxID=2763504 RepID=UPI0021C858C7|nr:transposase [Hymenobacter sp. BT188]